MGGDALKDRILDEIVASPRSLMIAHKISHPLKTSFPCQYLTADCRRGRGPVQLPNASSWVCCLWVGKALIQLWFTNLVRILHTSHKDIQGVGTFGSCLTMELHPIYSFGYLLPWQDSLFLSHVSLMCTIILLCWYQEMGWLCIGKQKGRHKSTFSLTEAWNFMKSMILAEAERLPTIIAGKLRHNKAAQPKQARAATLQDCSFKIWVPGSWLKIQIQEKDGGSQDQISNEEGKQKIYFGKGRKLRKQQK